jgi:hypothetical protein
MKTTASASTLALAALAAASLASAAPAQLNTGHLAASKRAPTPSNYTFVSLKSSPSSPFTQLTSSNARLFGAPFGRSL